MEQEFTGDQRLSLSLRLVLKLSVVCLSLSLRLVLKLSVFPREMLNLNIKRDILTKGVEV